MQSGRGRSLLGAYLAAVKREFWPCNAPEVLERGTDSTGGWGTPLDLREFKGAAKLSGEKGHSHDQIGIWVANYRVTRSQPQPALKQKLINPATATQKPYPPHHHNPKPEILPEVSLVLATNQADTACPTRRQ